MRCLAQSHPGPRLENPAASKRVPEAISKRNFPFVHRPQGRVAYIEARFAEACRASSTVQKVAAPFHRMERDSRTCLRRYRGHQSPCRLRHSSRITDRKDCTQISGKRFSLFVLGWRRHAARPPRRLAHRAETAGLDNEPSNTSQNGQSLRQIANGNTVSRRQLSARAPANAAALPR